MLGILFFVLSLGAPSASAQQDSQVAMQSITVKPGETLWSISQKYLKDPAKWDEILKYNKLPASDPTVALPGMTLRIPVQILKTELQAAQLAYHVNGVFYKPSGAADWTPAVDNMQVFRNGSIKTDANSKAGVKFVDGALMEVGPESTAIVAPPAKDYRLELKEGTVVASNKSVLVGGAVITPATAGTVYTATVQSGDTVIQVFKGQAAVTSAGKTVEVGAGKETEVKTGAAPSLAFDVTDLDKLKSLVSGYQSKLISLGLVLKESVTPMTRNEALTDGDKSAQAVGDLKAEADRIHLLEAVVGFHVECSRTQDFEKVIAKKYYEIGTTMDPTSFDVYPGMYWCRMAPVDLLENIGHWREPKQYFLGLPISH